MELPDAVFTPVAPRSPFVIVAAHVAPQSPPSQAALMIGAVGRVQSSLYAVLLALRVAVAVSFVFNIFHTCLVLWYANHGSGWGSRLLFVATAVAAIRDLVFAVALYKLHAHVQCFICGGAHQVNADSYVKTLLWGLQAAGVSVAQQVAFLRTVLSFAGTAKETLDETLNDAILMLTLPAPRAMLDDAMKTTPLPLQLDVSLRDANDWDDFDVDEHVLTLDGEPPSRATYRLASVERILASGARNPRTRSKISCLTHYQVVAPPDTELEKEE